ncbi:hypothetical protein VW29_17935, partial [Devosia limi DSM 17137]
MRPQTLTLNPAQHRVSGTVTLAERMGPETVISIRLPDGSSLLAVLPGEVAPALDVIASFSFRDPGMHLLRARLFAPWPRQ